MLAATATDSLLPRPTGGLLPGAALALLAHGLLLLALTSVMTWRAEPVQVVSAELWAALPQVPAPQAQAQAQAQAQTQTQTQKVEEAPAAAAPVARPEPEPAARSDAAIATERRKDKAVDQPARDDKAAADKKKRDDASREAARDTKLQEERLARQREENLKRMLGQAGGPVPSTASAGTAAQAAGPSANYAGRLVASIKPNIVFADTLPGNPAAEVEVRAAPSGSIIARRLVKSSGHPEWDDAVLRAIDRTGTLPRDTDGRVPATILVAFRQKE